METQFMHTGINGINAFLEDIEADTILLVIDYTVWTMYHDKLNIDPDQSSKKIITWKAQAGESTKNFTELEKASEFFIENGVHRNAHLVAIGGGATSDFAGLIASILLRGISWSVVPTTLLSMVDASIGGKTAINSQHGKNLVGTFHLPENILFCPEFLDTLPEYEVISGKGEVLKYGFLDKEIYEDIRTAKPFDQIILKCAEFKRKVVLEDFKEGGRRKILNFGHTIGHALEKIYSQPHGCAVMWGMAIMLGLFSTKSMLQDMMELKTALKWKVEESPWDKVGFPVLKIMDYIKKDKKVVGKESIDLVIIQQIGKPVIINNTFDQIRDALERTANEFERFSI